MPRVYTNKKCPLHGSDYCARLNMESCDVCTVRSRNGEEMELLKQDLDAIAKLIPEEGISELFQTDTCMLCRGTEKGKRTWYAQTDIGNAEPRRRHIGFLGIKREARTGSILPIQIACCDACRRRYLTLQYIAPITTAICMALGLILMSIRPIREPLMAITPALPAIVFVVFMLCGLMGGRLWRKALCARYGKKTYLSIFQIDALRRMRRLGWFELYEDRNVSRVVFSKMKLRQGLYTGACGHGAAAEPNAAVETTEE